MRKQHFKWGAGHASTFCVTVCLILIIPFAIAASGDAQSQADKQKVRRAPDKKPFKLKVADLFDENKVRFVMALERGNIRTISSRDDLSTVAEGSVLVARLNADVVMESLVDERARFVLPYRFEIIDPGDSKVMNLRTVAEVEQGGLRFDPLKNKFTGSLLVGIEDEDKPNAPRRNLPDPFVFQFTFNEGIVLPTSQSINHTNLPFHRVELAAIEQPISPHLKIMSSFDPSGVVLDIPVIPPKVKLGAPSTILGFGFGYCEVSVTLPPSLVGHIREVTLNTNQGILYPISLTLSDSGRGISKLRSSGTGKAKIEILDAHLESDPIYIHFVWPWILFIAIILGAVASGFLYKASDGKFLVGLILGIVVAIAYCVGFRIFKADLGKYITEAVAFVATALPGLARFGFVQLMGS